MTRLVPISGIYKRGAALWPRRLCSCACAAVLGAGIVLSGCGPDYGAISNRLREKNLQQERDLSDLKEKLTNRDATIADLQARLQGSAPALQTLPRERLADLFTATRLEIRGSSDTWDFGDGKGVSGFEVFIRPYSEDGQPLPATGTLTIEAFELPPSPAQPRRIGAWTFTPQEMKKKWFSGLGLNHFALPCPWQSPPTLSTVTFKAHLQDALTGNVLEAQFDKKITSPAPPQPAR